MIPSDSVFCDTGLFYAALASGDRHYQLVGDLLEQCHAQRVRMFSTRDVVSETVTLLTYRLHPRAAVQFLDTMKLVLALVPVTEAVLSQAEQIFRRHVRTRRLSFCDAVSFVVVTTLLDNIPCLSFDADFKTLGLTVLS